jgi:hypothetical protein
MLGEKELTEIETETETETYVHSSVGVCVAVDRVIGSTADGSILNSIADR